MYIITCINRSKNIWEFKTNISYHQCCGSGSEFGKKTNSIPDTKPYPYKATFLVIKYCLKYYTAKLFLYLFFRDTRCLNQVKKWHTNVCLKLRRRIKAGSGSGSAGKIGPDPQHTSWVLLFHLDISSLPADIVNFANYYISNSFPKNKKNRKISRIASLKKTFWKGRV